MQLQSLLQQQLKFYWNIRICDFNLVTNFVIHSFIDAISHPDQDCTNSERLNIV
jgi:hypothetical protein